MDVSEQFAFYQQERMGGLCILLFCKKKMLKRIKELYTCHVKSGWNGYSKNKGAVAMRLRIDQTSFAFLNCHLASGEGKVIKRLDMLRDIIDKIFADIKLSSQFANHDILFLIGDLNFRIAMSNFYLRD